MPDIVKISALPEADPLDGTEQVPVVQDGVTVRTGSAELGVPPEGGFRVFATEDEALADTHPQHVWLILEPLPAIDVAPGNVQAIAASDVRIDLHWDGVDSATSYEYRVDEGAEVDVGNVLTAAVEGLTPDTQYSFEVRAVNANGPGPWSDPVQETTQAEPTEPDAPTGLSATGGDGQVILAWTPSSGATGHRVYRNTSDDFGTSTQVGGDLAFNAAGFLDETVVNDTEYFYWVVAFNAVGESDPSVGDSATPEASGGPPVTDGMWFWRDPSDGATVTLDGSDNVEALADKSGANRHLGQATVGARPSLVSVGGRDMLDFAESEWLEDTATLSGTDKTYFAVVHLPQATHLSARRTLVESYNSSNAWHNLSLEINADNQLQCVARDNDNRFSFESATFPLQTTVVVGVRYVTGTAVTVWRNGSEVGTVAVGTLQTAANAGVRVGTYRNADGRWFIGYRGVEFHYNRALSDQEMADQMQWIMGQWGVS